MEKKLRVANRSPSFITCFAAALLLVAIVMNVTVTAGGPVDQASGQALRVTIIYDNYPCTEGLATDWGFAALIELGGDRILFDVGTQGELLLSNASKLGLELSSIDKVVLSHFHSDHTGGLQAFREQLAEGVMPSVYSLPSYPREFKREVSQWGRSVDSQPFQEIIPGLYTTGEISGPANEQALVIETGRGLVVVTGCAHPGIVRIIEAAKEHFGTEIYQVIGGFHLVTTPAAGIRSIISEFRRLGVQKVSATHCTGDEAIALFQEAYGENYLPGGAGRIFVIPGDDS